MDPESLETTAARPPNRRAHPRYSVDEEGRVQLVEHGLAMQSRILDLSLEGCRVRLTGQLPAGLHAGVEMTFTINGIPFRMGGAILRSDGSGELGIRFAQISAYRQAEWAEIVDEVQAIAAARAAEQLEQSSRTESVAPGETPGEAA